MAATISNEKRDLKGDHVENAKMKVEPQASADYSGAVAKSDPAEIALVRKLDYRIMPTLWSMYFLNYVCLFSFLFSIWENKTGY